VPFRLLARCVHGIEWVCAHEVEERFPDAAQIGVARREVSFRMPSLAPTALRLATADDVLLAVGGGPGATPAEVAGTLRKLPWAESVDAVRSLREVPSAPVLDVVAEVQGHRFSRFAVEHAVGPPLARLLGGTYLRRTAEGREPGDPDLTVRVSVREGAVAAAVRLAARPLHRRGWKRDTGPGTLHPPLAAALARLAAPDAGESVVDPFCGDGTIAVETALAFPGARVAGHDLDPARLDNARRNAERAGAPVTFTRVDAGRPSAQADAVITNPPWNLAVDGAGTLRDGLGPLWRRLPELLTPTGRFVAVTDATLDAPAALARAGVAVGLATRVRLGGRVSDIVLAAPTHPPELPASLAARRAGAIAAGVVTAEGF
jgi:tRNA (guanine6-N2)-methyltransferase